jgi:outer membrane protein
MSLLLLTVALSSQAQSDTVKLTLNQAVAMALQQNNDVAISSLNAELSESLVRETKGNFLPKLTAYGNYTRNIDKAVIFFPDVTGEGKVNAIELGSDNTYDAGLNLALPAYSRFNSTYKNYAYANQNIKMEIDRGTRHTIIANVKKAYYSYLIVLASKNAIEKSLSNALENLQNVQDKLEQGIVTEFDETSAKVQVIIAKNNLLEAETNIVPSANRLKLLLGLDVTDAIELTDDLLQEEYPITQVEPKDGLSQNSDLKQKALQVELANQQMEVTKADYYPRLNVVGNYQYQSQADDFDVGQYDWVKTSNMGLQLQIPLFNGTVTKHKVQQASIDREIAERQKQYTTTTNQMAYAEIINQLDYAVQRVTVQQENIELAQLALDMAKERYNYGKATFLEVNDAELSLIQARLNWLQAILDYKFAYYDYELLTGKE